MDIIGIGSLNLDFRLTAEKINTLPADRVMEVKRRLDYGVERPMELYEIEDIISLLGPDSFSAALGGSAFNTIHAMAALNSGIKTGYVGVAGDTRDTGLSFMELMQELSIHSKYVDTHVDQSSGLCICINQKGVRSFLYHPGCNDKMADYLQEKYDDILLYLIKAKILHITQFNDERTSIILARLIQDAKRNNPSIKISCDPGYTWIKNLTNPVISIIKMAEFLFLNAIEFNLLADCGLHTSDLEKADRVFEHYGLNETFIIVKKESEIKIYCRSNQRTTEQHFKVNVISRKQISDSTGAGDMFAAGFLTVQLLKEGMALEDSVELGIRFMRAKLLMPPEMLYKELTRIFSEAGVTAGVTGTSDIRYNGVTK